MRRLRPLSLLPLLLSSLILLTCTGQSPFKPSDATVTPVLENSAGQKSGTTISDSVGKQVSITLTAYLPSYIDSVKVIVFSATDTDSVHVFDKATIWTDAQTFNIIFRSAGSRTVSIVVFAGGIEKTVTASIIIAGKPTLNRPPVLEVSGVRNILTAQTCSLSLSVQDSDAGQTHSFALIKGPQGATLTGVTFKWTPPPAFTGSDSAEFSVTDNGTPPLSDSLTVLITVSSVIAVQITTPLAATTYITAGGTTALQIVAGGANLSYQWYYNGSAITGATASSYSKTWAAMDGGVYKVVVSNGAGKDSSTTQVTISPLITTGLGASTSMAINSTAALSVTATGTAPLTYQWYYNGTAITGANTSSYSKTWASGDGGVYKVVVTNAAGSDSSKTTVTINSSISTPLPGTTNIVQGSTTPLTIVASGTPPMTYQWYYNGTAITGATSASYSKTWGGADGGVYKVVVTNPTGKDSSSTQLTVSPVITSALAANTSVIQSGSTALSVTASGTAPTYQWYYNGAAISGATSSLYSKTWTATDGGTYKVVVTNAAGKDSSSTQVTVSPLITAGLGVSTSIAVGSSTPLSVTAGGTAPLTFQWYYNGTVITGATSSSYSKTWASGDGGVYKVVVTNAAGGDSSKTTVTINSSITTPLPGTTNVTQGSSTALTIVASGTPPVTYQWYYNGAAITGAITASYSKTWGADDGGAYKVVVTNGSGKDSSSTQLVVAPVITSGLSSTTYVSQGGKVALSVTATGTSPLSYQWYLNGTAIPGATGGSYSKTVAAADGGVYKVIVSNAAGSDSSSTQVTVLVPPTVVTHPLSQSRDKGSSVTFSVTINSDVNPSPAYAWFKQGSTTVLATSATYQKSSLAYADAGKYRVAVTNSAGTDTSNWATLTVNDVTPPVITLTGSADTTIPLNATWTDPGAVAADDRDGNISASIVKTGSANTLAVGKYTVTYNVSDAAGNAAAAKIRTVRVEGWELVNSTGIAVTDNFGFSMKLVNNNLYIAYVDNSDTKTYVKKLNGLNWDLVGGGPVDALTANMLSLAVSSDGTTPYIGYVSTQTNKATIVSRLQGGTWQTLFTSQYDYAWSSFADVEISPTGAIYLVDDLSPSGYSGPEFTSLMKYNTVTSQMVPTDTLGGAIYRNYYKEEKDLHVLAFSSDGTPYITYRGPGGFTIKKKSGTSWIGAGSTAADSIFDVAYSAPLQTVFSNNNLFVLVSSDGANPTVYNLKSGNWTSLGTITSSGSVQPYLSAIGDTCYISYASTTDGSVYVKKIVNGTIKNVPEISSNGLAITGSFNYSWIEVGSGIVYAAGRDQSTGIISLMKYIKQ